MISSSLGYGACSGSRRNSKISYSNRPEWLPKGLLQRYAAEVCIFFGLAKVSFTLNGPYELITLIASLP
ncbi:hypothetical protein L2E82_28166 [Cichorium intybus]|uniref:Uncharacterized protein n=1 Tax=Cichorium intybus TaxID=13427 RepID=A0ACB9CVN7_CICIN|nr:hypothetical protein L2E82_28166 [Cichorium intybus]